MIEKKCAEEVKKIEMPKEMRERILDNCYTEMEEMTMRKNNGKNVFRKPMVAAAVLVACLCVTGVGAMAATGKLTGFFQDVTGLFGAVTGTTYEQATDEIEMKITEVSDILAVEMEMDGTKAPYRELETIEVGSYRIVSADGDVVAKDEMSTAAPIVDGTASVSVALPDVAAGTYKLVITELIGSKKADQPLPIYGEWECEFVK
ncbi:MAG: hypothetical protein IJX95_04935 [Lachnospiraceae bacterium]|nr:hypothetical protein [Lachnospiraceae bacterium]